MKLKNKVGILLLCILSCIVSVAPMLIYFFINYDKYTETFSQGIKLCFGGILLLFLIVLKVIGKLHINNRSTFFIILFALSYFLEGILSDLLIFSSLALLGEVLDTIVSIPLKNLREKEKGDRYADITAKKVDQIFKKYYRGDDI